MIDIQHFEIVCLLAFYITQVPLFWCTDRVATDDPILFLQRL